VPVAVSDARSNANDQIAHAATVLGRSEHRRAVFEAICAGKKRVKTVSEIAAKTGLTNKQVLMAAHYCVSNHLFGQVKAGAETGYEKDPFYANHAQKILRLSRDRKQLEALPTKTRPHGLPSARGSVSVSLPRAHIQIQLVTVDDFVQFQLVRKRPATTQRATMSETKFKRGVQQLVNEQGTFKDWGGERNDLWTTRVRLNGKRVAAAFAFKGPGQRGKLTPARMGRNGDQIARLFQSEATVFLLQYWDSIDESVLEHMRVFATSKSVSTGQKIHYGIIDGSDTQRLVEAYPKAFT
jgi:hypothetical protein